MKLFLTGLNSFLSQSLIRRLGDTEHSVSGSIRPFSTFKNNIIENITQNELLPDENWSEAILGVDVVIHTAARAHILHEIAADPLKEYRNINTASTLHLAKQAAEAGASRFIFISSIGVNGNSNTLPFKELDKPAPQEPYAISKYEAEQGLLKIAEETGMEVVIIRPPLVYGPGVKANFLSMIKWVERGIPLPFGAINNQRSLVALDNLVDFIIHCIDHPKAANEIFLISDDEDVSTTQLLRKVALALGKRSMLIPIPVSWMKFVAKRLGKQAVTERLFSSLQVDSSKARDLLGWQPVTTMDEQLTKTVDTYLNEKII
ncbi:UDP-glucose 4-epimerase [Methylophaga sp. 41_12_T18]|nr:UDP-glucose 4-epimerase [Methylophaga sp. 41_12_T18]